ncbi:MAG: gas vesicle protein GvpG [Planctomycetes bacterium]|nr:gas vesicle protein GvpG [Planctomycetota bacterium]MBI3844847.1 gas vesicle protein GvpG [Planctomycetota bacterium]
MFLVDKMIIGGLRFVFDKIAKAVDQEMNDDRHLLDELLAAQMRLELGEISEEEFAAIEDVLLRRIREIRERRTTPTATEGNLKVTGIEASVGGDEEL